MRYFCFVTNPIIRSETIATKYSNHTSSNGGMTDTKTFTTTYMPPKILEAIIKYRELNKVLFIFCTFRFLFRSIKPLTERGSHFLSIY